MRHELKIAPKYFVGVDRGVKKFEIRKDDRPFKTGDTLWLREYKFPGEYTGLWVCALVTDVFRDPGFGLQDGYCIMSIEVTNWGSDVDEVP